MVKNNSGPPVDRPLRVLLLGAGGRPDVRAEAQRLRPIIEQYAQVVRADFTGTEDLSNVEADLAIVRVSGKGVDGYLEAVDALAATMQ